MKEKITFIIPTIGRATLIRTTNSLINQSDPDWRAIVVCDGISNIRFGDSRFSCFSIPKTGIRNHAGNVRNFGIDKAETEWIAFVDDDDTISPNYVARFKKEIEKNSKIDCIIFRMYDLIRGPLPPIESINFKKNYVGISFAVKKNLNIKFDPSETEDFYYLDKIRSLKRKIVISPYINYFVRGDVNKEIEKVLLKRIIIN